MICVSENCFQTLTATLIVSVSSHVNRFGADVYSPKEPQSHTVTAVSEDVFCLSLPVAKVIEVLSSNELEHSMKQVV